MKFTHPFSKRHITGICMTLLFCRIAVAQEVSLHATLDTAQALMGDQLRLSLQVEKPASARVQFPLLGDTLAGGIEIIHISPIDSSRVEEGKTRLKQELLITVFDTGAFEVPSLPFVLQTGTINDTLHTLPVYFTVIPIQGDTTLRDIKENMKAPLSLREVFPWMLSLWLATLLIALGWWWIRKRKKSRVPGEPARPADPPDVTALRLLEQMRVEKTWQLKPVKVYYISLTEILRVYIQHRFGVYALEQTTDEILASLRGAGCETGALNRLKAVLRLSDLVKFAKAIPDEAENAQQVNEAMEFVKATSVTAGSLNPGTVETKQDAPKEGAE
jgi:hypothetical protein